jgi:hypothetical protein
MTAAEKQDEWWLDLQRRREERMRFEVLSMLFEAANRRVDFPVDIGGFIRRLGVWEGELERVLEFLDSQGFIVYERSVQEVRACLTVKGVDYIERDARRRRTIRLP